ncbi:MULTISPECIES: hypothetical protein [Halomonadaceae]|uniref:hypothetical protein n=1 Tax=Halomonadaceae TaxID=28256 RepID=UPI000C33EF46|nr:hypothetical protein [Halomonas sp. MES3-P3E]PKG54767.1 hypothetical protein CXF87_01165 [Halomonas sp. MES3-P3E]
MYAIEFEADIKNEYIRLPQFEKLKNRHVKIIVLAEDSAEPDHETTIQRYPAKVPPIAFKADILDTVPDSSWDLT